MAQTTIAPSINTYESLAPENPESLVLGDNPRIKRIARHAERAAEVQCTVLVTGETGTGKEIWARLLHRLSPRRNKPFVPVNCAALTATLAESQLFGHEKGAFTGAVGRSLGIFRAGTSGVVFLDEVGEMPLELQPKLLRVLQEQEVTPVGSTKSEKIDVQIVAATNRNLEDEVAAGRFREDLYYRLNMVELHVPSLRQRSEDIPLFIKYFAHKFAAKYKNKIWNPTEDELKQFCEYHWPGNIRQLGHVIEQGYVLDCVPTIPERAAKAAPDISLPFTDLNKLRRVAICQALNTTKGHKGQAAKLLGVHPNTMTRLLAQIDKNQKEASA